MAQQYEAGDIVQLKSGGPKMTVTEYPTSSGNVRAQWFAGSKLEAGIFHPDALQRYVEPPKPKAL